MRKSLVILIIASAILLSVVESKKHIRKQTTEEIRGVPMLIGSGIKSTTNAPTPTYYTKANTKCFSACEASGGNSINYYYYNRYLCCDIGLNSYGLTDGWYNMYCYAQALNCQGD